jgi:hypothetical protein
MARDELLRLRASAEAQAATLALDLEALFTASRDSNADDEHDPEGATIGFERAQLTALLAAARERIATSTTRCAGSTPRPTASAKHAGSRSPMNGSPCVWGANSAFGVLPDPGSRLDVHGRL